MSSASTREVLVPDDVTRSALVVDWPAGTFVGPEPHPDAAIDDVVGEQLEAVHRLIERRRATQRRIRDAAEMAAAKAVDDNGEAVMRLVERRAELARRTEAVQLARAEGRIRTPRSS